MYPQAKVVLVERNVDDWYKSFNAGVIDAFWKNAPALRLIAPLDPQLLKLVHAIWVRLFAYHDGYFASTSKEEMQANARKVYEDHYALVRRVTLPERLLEYALEEGWQPLCRFLGVYDVPTEPFPKINEGEALKEVV